MKKQQSEVSTDRALTPALPAQNPETHSRTDAASTLNGATTCSQITKSGKRCGHPAMGNGKCRLHGGKATGAVMARPGNRNARKHGAYCPILECDAERFQYDSFVNDIFREHKNLNRTTDMPHVKIAAMAFVRLWKALLGNASGSTVDDLSRMFCRHCAALKINRDRRPTERDDGLLPRSAAEYAAQLVEQMKANKAGDKK